MRSSQKTIVTPFKAIHKTSRKHTRWHPRFLHAQLHLAITLLKARFHSRNANHPWHAFWWNWYGGGGIRMVQTFCAGKHRFSPMVAHMGRYPIEPVWSFDDAWVVRAIWAIIRPCVKHIILTKACVHLQGPSAIKSVISRIDRALNTGSFRYVIRADIKGYYASIHRPTLLHQLNSVFDDTRLHTYFEAIVNPLIDYGTHLASSDEGIPRRSSLSPFFAALYLNTLDRHFAEKTSTFYVRYNDDILILCRTADQYKRAKKQLKQITQDLKLRLSPTKTTMGHIEKGFHFLGVSFALNQGHATAPNTDRHAAASSQQCDAQSASHHDGKKNTQRTYSCIRQWLRALGFSSYAGSRSDAQTQIETKPWVASLHPRCCHRAINRALEHTCLEAERRWRRIIEVCPTLSQYGWPPPCDNMTPLDRFNAWLTFAPELITAIMGYPKQRITYWLNWQHWWYRTTKPVGS